MNIGSHRVRLPIFGLILALLLVSTISAKSGDFARDIGSINLQQMNCQDRNDYYSEHTEMMGPLSLFPFWLNGYFTAKNKRVYKPIEAKELTKLLTEIPSEKDICPEFPLKKLSEIYLEYEDIYRSFNPMHIENGWLGGDLSLTSYDQIFSIKCSDIIGSTTSEIAKRERGMVFPLGFLLIWFDGFFVGNGHYDKTIYQYLYPKEAYNRKDRQLSVVEIYTDCRSNGSALFVELAKKYLVFDKPNTAEP